MDRIRRPATAGVLASLATLVVALSPYAHPELTAALIHDADAVAETQPYYGYGLLGGWSVVPLAAIGVVVFASGRQRRTDPSTAAGAGLGVGIAATILSLYWWLALPSDFLAAYVTDPIFVFHPELLVLSSLSIAVAGVWYARALELL